MNPRTQERPILLIVEDDSQFRQTLELEFSDRGYEVKAVGSLSELRKMGRLDLRFAIVDLRLGTESGLEAAQIIRAFSPDCRILILTGYGSIATAVKAVKLGAVNYLTKPVSMELLEKALWVDLPAESAQGGLGKPMSLARHEREYIEFVIAQCNGNITRAAQWLGVHRQSLQRKLRKFVHIKSDVSPKMQQNAAFRPWPPNVKKP